MILWAINFKRDINALPVNQKIYGLMLWLTNHLNHFPRARRHAEHANTFQLRKALFNEAIFIRNSD